MGLDAAAEPMTAAVDLVVNTYERSYRRVLQPGFFTGIEEQCRRPFTGRVALINNVDDSGDAHARAQALVASGELTSFHFVNERVEGALSATGLAGQDLGPAGVFTVFLLVAVTLPGAPWMVHWDAEVHLTREGDWISAAIELMERDHRVMCANPDNSNHPASHGEPDGRFLLAPGFSDQLFLVRRSDFARPIYGERCIASLRYPLSEMGRTFEMRVDSYMRHHRRLRANHLDSCYFHPPQTAGRFHPKLTWVQRLRRKWKLAALAYLRSAPRAMRPRCARDLGGGV
jgi:hypothetical protein